MGAHRKKHRTHVPSSENPSEDKKNIPKSFVVHSGSEISRQGNQLVRDLRKVMEPNTASRLNERRNNKIKDFLAMAGPLGVSHISLISETESSMNLRLAKFPRGPTLYFRILEYALAGDVRAAAKRPRSPGLEFATAPLLVLNNFNIKDNPEHKLIVTVLQNYYPSLNAAKVKLVSLRRVVLYQYDNERDVVLFRHYVIRVKENGLSRLSKVLANGKLPEKLGECADIAEYIAKSTGAASDSEFEEDSLVTLGQDYLGNYNAKSSRRAVTLAEIGPRLTLKLIKISDGLNGGKVLYHVPQENSGS
jgi:ribosome biogenesis protein SSF1/2